MVTVAVVSRLSGFSPAFSSCADRAIVKHPACAAAMSSSGLVPLPCSKRVENEYWAVASTALAVEITPGPSFNPPCQRAEAVRFMVPPEVQGTAAFADGLAMFRRAWG